MHALERMRFDKAIDPAPQATATLAELRATVEVQKATIRKWRDLAEQRLKTTPPLPAKAVGHHASGPIAPGSGQGQRLTRS